MKTYRIFRLLVKNLSTSGAKIQQGCGNFILHVQRTILVKSLLEKVYIFNNLFRSLSEEFSVFQRTLFVGIVKNALNESIGTFLEVFKKSEHVNSELVGPEKKSNLLRERPSDRNLLYDGKKLQRKMIRKKQKKP